MQEQYVRLKWAEAPKSLRHAKSMRKKIARFIDFKSKVSDLLDEHKNTLAEGKRPKEFDQDFAPLLSDYADFKKSGRHLRGPFHVYPRIASMAASGFAGYLAGGQESMHPVEAWVMPTMMVVSVFAPEFSALAYATGNRVISKFHSPEATVARNHVMSLPKGLEGRELERAKKTNLKLIEDAIAHNDKLIAAHESKLGELDEFISRVEAEKKAQRKAMFSKLVRKLVPTKGA